MNREIQKAKIATLFLVYIGLFKRNMVIGDSMDPLLHDGDIVFSKKTLDLQIGDIVIARHPFRKKEIVKQIVKIVGNSLELRGLNKNESEDSGTFGSISKKDVLRVIVAKKYKI